MSLATRCPSCGTVFRVVHDQLRVSEGWVRCGRCNGVFNAAEVLFDIDSGAPVLIDLGLAGAAAAAPPPPAGLPATAPLPPDPAPGWTAAPAPTFSARAPAAEAPDPRQEPHFDAAPLATGAAAVEPRWADAGAPEADDRIAPADEPFLRTPSRSHDDHAVALADEIVITDHVSAAPGAAVADAPLQPAPAASPVQAMPSFMRTAERDALWRSPAMRAGLAVIVTLLALALLLQAALFWRDSLAARLPATTPALNALCRLAGCSVQPLRRIEAMAVHSSGLNRLEGSTLHRLQVVLQNRADTAVMMPALELSLTDAQGRLVARRVLQAAELGAPQPVLQAGEELPIKALVSTGERRVDGYTLELFYP